MKDQTNDIHGRLNVMHKGKEICNNFNGVKGCINASCSFLHFCNSKQVSSEVTNSSEKPKNVG